jgi:tetratricopeptide (TPR) repeat protein
MSRGSGCPGGASLENATRGLESLHAYHVAGSLLLALLLLYLAGCEPDRGAVYPAAMVRAEQAEARHDYQGAEAAYLEAAGGAKVERDAAHARFLAACTLDEAGDVARALAAFKVIADASPPQEHSAEAAYRAASLRIRMGDEHGWKDIEEAVVRFPTADIARPAFVRLLRHLRETGRVDALRALEPRLVETERGEELDYEIARALADAGRTREAREEFVHVAAKWPYPKGLLFDDALYRASELDEAEGRYGDAIADLEAMLGVRESSLLVGSYERPRYDAAQLRIADLYEQRLHDDARARAALHKLYADFPTSLLRDKALFREAELTGKDGGRRCELLQLLVHDFPDSRYVPCAVERCGEIKPPPGKAPKTCRAYIERADAPR